MYNSFGHLFRITTWGESHGKAIGVVIDGCPAGLEISEEEIQAELAWRQPGKSPYTSPRKESDKAELLSGLFEGKTTGAPLSILIPNRDADPSAYEGIKNVMRPGHANFTYLAKYGIFDYRGGGRASARETACRVAAGAVAKKLLAKQGIQVVAYIRSIGPVEMAKEPFPDLEECRYQTRSSPLFCPDPIATLTMMAVLEKVKEEGDSLGGVVELISSPLPIGLGNPVYAKLEAQLAQAMLSLPASKGFEIGAGFAAGQMKGSEHNDRFDVDAEGQIFQTSNMAGGTLAGISCGTPLQLRVAFKPPSSIRRSQETVSLTGEKLSFSLPENSRHDPCVAIRAVPVVEAMAALVLADAWLMQRCSRVEVMALES
jgi:chorismate synthase